MDKIFLKGCRFYGYHGYCSEEQMLGQIFVVDCEITIDLTKASISDCLSDTVHYGNIFELLKYHVESEKYTLIEKLAGIIIENIFLNFPLVKKTKITINKEKSPIVGHYDAVGVELERVRPL